VCHHQGIVQEYRDLEGRDGSHLRLIIPSLKARRGVGESVCTLRMEAKDRDRDRDRDRIGIGVKIEIGDLSIRVSVRRDEDYTLYMDIHFSQLHRCFWIRYL
jgi:hypothetical protein